jgi:hypothetical protein
MGAFIFVPVPSAASTEDLNRWGKGRERIGKQPYKVLMNPFSKGFMKGFARGAGLGCLSRVKTTEKLYVYAHGAAEAGIIGGKRNDGLSKNYSVPELADLLVAEGLSKAHQDLRLYLCESGVGDQPFALQLKNAMVARGYSSLTVTGYMGNVKPSYARRQIKDSTAHGDGTEQEHKGVEQDGFIFRASQFRRTF